MTTPLTDPTVRTAALPSDEIGHLLLRYRRSHTLDRFQPQLDRFLKQVLILAREFLPSDSGVIFLDDPQLKLQDARGTTLTIVGACGADPARLLGHQQPCTAGIAGHVYSNGQSLSRTAAEDPIHCARLSAQLGETVSSVLAVPVVIGNSTCGVLLLVNRQDAPAFGPRDRRLLELFADYLSSSMQNMLDAIRSTEVARRDDLTGLYNDRYLQFRLREEITLARQSGADVALLFFDLDNFKQINDHHGHLEGSRTLSEVGLLLQRDLPTPLIAARYGGDEFVIILPGHTTDDTVLIAHRLRDGFAQHTFLRGGDCELPRGSVTASFGITSLAQHPHREGTPRELANALIRAADSAMYAAKARGKNTVVIAPG